MGLDVLGGGQVQSVTDTYVGTASAVVIQLGFTPSLVFVFNQTDANAAWSWNPSLPDAHAVQVSATAGLVTTNGITVSGRQVTLGTALSTSGKTFKFVAMR